MGLKPDRWIRQMALDIGMIEPFVDEQVREGVIRLRTLFLWLRYARG